MANKYYAVKIGLTPGIYSSWEDCKVNVNGYPNAVYKSFKSLEEARAFLGVEGDFSIINDPSVKNDSSAPKDSLAANNSPVLVSDSEAISYVDGSYRDDTKEFAFGAVIFHNGREIHKSGKSNDPELVEMRNVAGEITGSIAAMEYALSKGCKKLTIYHDYEGIAKWCLGQWKANKPGTQAYRDFYNSIKNKIQIDFVKVKGHSNDKYNDLADALAKEALGIDVF